MILQMLPSSNSYACPGGVSFFLVRFRGCLAEVLAVVCRGRRSRDPEGAAAPAALGAAAGAAALEGAAAQPGAIALAQPGAVALAQPGAVAGAVALAEPGAVALEASSSSLRP